MADVTDPLPADRAGIDGMDEDSAGRLQVGMSTRQCAGQVVVALSGDLDVADTARVGALLAAVAIRVPWLIVDLAGLEFTDCAGCARWRRPPSRPDRRGAAWYWPPRGRRCCECLT